MFLAASEEHCSAAVAARWELKRRPRHEIAKVSRRDLGQSLNNIAAHLGRRNRVTEALALYQRAVEHGEAAVALPGQVLARDRVRYSFAGLRVLPRGGGSTARAHREELIETGSAGMVSVAGGKLTTHRQIAVRVLRRLEAFRDARPTSDPLPGAGPLPPARWPTRALARRWRALERIAQDLNHNEDDAGLSETRAPDPGFVPYAYDWVAGEDLADVLGDDTEMTGGDFVRHVKQCIDLLRQIGDVAPKPETATTARAAADACFRGVIAASSAVGR